MAEASGLASPLAAVVVFVKRGDKLEKRADGSGRTGNWLFQAKRRPTRVIVYDRLQDRPYRKSEVWVANYAGAFPSIEPGRFVLKFKNLSQPFVTTESWPEFADTGRGPVRYLIGK